MHWANEIVEPSSLDLPGHEKLPEAEMKMAKMLIDTMSVDDFEPEKFTNRYHDEMLAMIEARAQGKELPKAKKAPRARKGGQPHGRPRAKPRGKQEAPRLERPQRFFGKTRKEDHSQTQEIRRLGLPSVILSLSKDSRMWAMPVCVWFDKLIGKKGYR